jgi:hypothetical protein
MKYKQQIISGVCLAALVVCAPLTVSAARAKKDASPAADASASVAATTSPTAKTERAIPFHGMIASVDAKTKTFTIVGKGKSRAFKITDATKLMKSGNPATMKDVVANEEVRGSYWKAADGNLEAKTVKLGPMTEAEKAVVANKSSRKHKDADAMASPAASIERSPAASASPKP